MKRKLLALLLALVLCLGLMACQKDTAETTTEDTSSVISTASITSGEDSSASSSEEATSSVTASKGTSGNVSKASKASSEKKTVAGSSKVTASSVKTEQKASNITPLLYKVSNSKGNTLWLFGSIHRGKESFFPLPNYVMNAFNSADSLTVEFDIIAFEKDTASQQRALRQLIYTDGTTTKDHISAETYNKAVEILKENNQYSPYLDYYMPSLWSSFIDSVTNDEIGADAGYGIDRHLLDTAYEKNKSIESIESAESQYGMMAGFSDSLQELLLQSSIYSYYNNSSSKNEFNSLADVWAKGDETAYRKMLDSEYEFENDEEKALYEEYTKAMRTDRDLLMTAYAEKALKSGKNTFICVGAAHVSATGGMVDQLKAKGYKVEIIKK